MKTHSEMIKDAIEADGPYSRNIIRTTLRMVSRKMANRLIDRHNLIDYGFNKEPHTQEK